MKRTLDDIKACRICQPFLDHEARPVVTGSETSRIVIVGQAPGRRVHQTGIPWNDPSGDLLRSWMGVDRETFYDTAKIALIPMGFCYPGKGRSGDLPPRPECAPRWHAGLIGQIINRQLTVLIGQYSQQHYLGERRHRTLAETVRNYREYLPEHFPLPHPSPRNRLWLRNNPWFAEDVLPVFRALIHGILSGRPVANEQIS